MTKNPIILAVMLVTVCIAVGGGLYLIVSPSSSDVEGVVAFQNDEAPAAPETVQERPTALNENKPPQIQPVLMMFGAVSLYQKNGVVENYGVSLEPLYAGPIRLSGTRIHMVEDRGISIWSPDFGYAGDADRLALRFSEEPVSITHVRAGLILADGRSLVFEISFEDSIAPQSTEMAYMNADHLTATQSPTVTRPLQRSSKTEFSGTLPPDFVQSIAEAGATGIVSMFLDLGAHADANVDVVHFGLVGSGSQQTETPNNTTNLSGEVQNAIVLPGSEVQLLFEDGRVLSHQLSLDGTFVFNDLPRGQVVSLVYRAENMDWFSNLGRWFMLSGSQRIVTVDATPRFVNTDGRSPSADAGRSTGTSTPAPHGNVLRPHTRLVWPGHATVPTQEYDALSFANNHGYLDRDRFFKNESGCIRIVHLGSSLANAQQVPVFQKYNIVLEAKLSVALGRCVEVVTAGRDNGDIGANYNRLRFYAMEFEPDLILIENGVSLMWQLQPDLLRRYLGVDYSNNMLDHFFRDADGSLEFRAMSPNWPLYSQPNDYSNMDGGIPFSNSLSVDFDVMPPEGLDAFERLQEIVKFVSEENPGTPIALHTGLDQAVCSSEDKCSVEILVDGGRFVSSGSSVFLDNFMKGCRSNDMLCFNPEVDADRDGTLIFKYDSHYSPRGHQWLAKELASFAEAILAGE